MPIFELVCKICGYTEDRLMRFAGVLPNCPKCNKQLVRLFSAPALIRMEGFGSKVWRRQNKNGSYVDGKY